MACRLIIDDDDHSRTLLRARFEDEGDDVLEASHGAAGLWAYRTQGVDGVMKDRVMPGKG